jgi:hypothetical protein
MENIPEDSNQSVTRQSFGGKLKSWWRRGGATPLKTSEKIVGVILIIIFLFAFYIALDANKYRSLVHVIAGEGKVGVNPTAEALDFGDLSRGTSAVRRVDIKNGTFMPMYVAILKTGSISDLTKIDKNFFKLAPNSETKVEFTVYMPASAPIDSNYDGRVYLFKIPTFGI